METESDDGKVSRNSNRILKIKKIKKIAKKIHNIPTRFFTVIESWLSIQFKTGLNLTFVRNFPTKLQRALSR